jgi:hypothetical protein
VPGVKEIWISSWNELNERLYEETWNPEIKRFRANFVYRGMADREDDLRTSLARLGEGYGNLEHHLLRNFKKYARKNAVWDESVWNWLSVAAHHGLPTRLLDWTYSPFVALHFATDDLKQFDRDAVVWKVDYVAAHKLLPPKLKEILQAEPANAFTVEMLIRGASTLRELQMLSSEPFVVFFEPPSLDERIVNQFALFSMLSDAVTRMDDWLDAHPELAQRIIIPASFKWEVRDKLDQANITERVLFPGLDGLSRWLKRHYYPRT